MSVIAAPPRPKIEVTSYDGPTDIADLMRISEFLAKAVATLPVVYRDRPADIFAVILHARALNIPVMTAIHNLVWDESLGKGAMTAQLMGALLLRGGVGFTHEFDGTVVCSMKFTRSDGLAGGTVDWKMIEAIGAGIANNHTWQVYPRDMLFARCLSRGARRFAPDLILGFGHTIDELREMKDHEPAHNDRKPEPEVLDFLAQVTDTTSAAMIQELKKLAGSKKFDLADKYAGNGRTVAEQLNRWWLDATAREMEKSLGAADKAMAAEPIPVPGSAAGSAAKPTELAPNVAEAPAGEGDAACGCPNGRLVSGEGHDPARCNKLKGASGE